MNEIERMMEPARAAARRLGALCHDLGKGLAADFGETYDQNPWYWATFANLSVTSGHPNPPDSGSPQLRAIHDLACSVTPRNAPKWRPAHEIVRRLFDNMDGGEELGLGPLLDLDLDDPEQRAEAMRLAADFHEVPAAYGPAVGEAVTALMLGFWNDYRGDDGRWLPQAWASNYALVVGSICERCRALPPVNHH